MKKKFSIFFLSIIMILSLVSCGNNSSNNSENNEQNTQTVENKDDKRDLKYVLRDGEPLPDGEGIFKIGKVSSSPFRGIFSSIFYSSGEDSDIMKDTMWGSFGTDLEYKTANNGPCKVDLDKENKTLTIHIDKNYTWNDGVPVTADDFKFAYEIVGHGDYTGPRYGSEYENIIGMQEYHWGTMNEETKEKLLASGNFDLPSDFKPAKEISGIKVIDDKTLQIQFKKVGVDVLWGSGLVSEPVPYHQLKDIPVIKMEESDAVRKNPLSCGPYYIVNVVPGESVLFKANEYYWGGKPHIPQLEYRVISPDKLVSSMKAGEFDLYKGVPSSSYQDIKNLDNYDILMNYGLSYSYMGFKLGKWDKDARKAIYDPNSKMADLNLRKAMEMSVDRDYLAVELFDNLRQSASTIIPLAFDSIHNFDLKPVRYDFEGAKKILDDAGYKDIDNDGFRENPKGEKLKINVAGMISDEAQNQKMDYYLQQWRDLGLDVAYTNGRLLDFNNFYDMVQDDDENIDVFFGAWGTGTNPAPYGLYGENASWNFSRFVDPEFEKLLKSVESEEAFDNDYRLQQYKKIQEFVYNNKQICPEFYGKALVVVNKRVKEWDIRPTDGTEKFDTFADIQLLAKEPIKYSK